MSKVVDCDSMVVQLYDRMLNYMSSMDADDWDYFKGQYPTMSVLKEMVLSLKEAGYTDANIYDEDVTNLSNWIHAREV